MPDWQLPHLGLADVTFRVLVGVSIIHHLVHFLVKLEDFSNAFWAKVVVLLLTVVLLPLFGVLVGRIDVFLAGLTIANISSKVLLKHFVPHTVSGTSIYYIHCNTFCSTRPQTFSVLWLIYLDIPNTRWGHRFTVDVVEIEVFLLGDNLVVNLWQSFDECTLSTPCLSYNKKGIVSIAYWVIKEG